MQVELEDIVFASRNKGRRVHEERKEAEEEIENGAAAERRIKEMGDEGAAERTNGKGNNKEGIRRMHEKEERGCGHVLEAPRALVDLSLHINNRWARVPISSHLAHHFRSPSPTSLPCTRLLLISALHPPAASRPSGPFPLRGP